MKIKICISRILFFILIILPIYQDTPLIKYLGAGGYTLLLPVSILSMIIYIIVKKTLPKNKYIDGLVRLWCLMAIVSYIAIVVWILMGNSIMSLSEFLPFKATKVLLIFLSYIAYVLLIIICTRKNSTYYIGKYSFVTLVILTLICIIEKSQIPYALKGIHYASEFPYWRIRLLTMESSWTASMIFAYSALAILWAYKYHKKILLIISLLCDFILIINSGSKTLIMSIAIFSVVYLFIITKKINKRRFISLIFVISLLFIFANFLLPELKSGFSIDIENYTSTSTRLYTSVIGLLIGIAFPFGLGGAVSLPVFQFCLRKYLPIFMKFPLKMNYTEIIGLTEKTTGDALTVKSGIINQNMYWGIIGSILLFRNFILVTNDLRKFDSSYSDFITAIFWSSIILLFSCNFTYEFWLIYAFVVSLIEELNRNIRLKGECIYE